MKAANKEKIKPSQAAMLLVLCFAGALIIFPLIVTLAGSFMSEAEISLRYTTSLSVFDILEGVSERFVQIALIPHEVTLDQYFTVLIDQPMFMMLMLNSVRITVPVVMLGVIVSLLGAYGFTVWNFRYKETVFFVYIVVMLMPLVAVLVPNYIIAERLGLIGSLWAIILPGIFSPFGTFLLRQNMKSIPSSYFEAARIDGASSLYILIHIVIPQVKSGIAALSMLVFIEYWNLVEQAVVFIRDPHAEPLSVFLSRIAAGRIGLIFAVSCVYMFFPVWFLLFGQKDLEKGIELSGVK